MWSNILAFRPPTFRYCFDSFELLYSNYNNHAQQAAAINIIRASIVALIRYHLARCYQHEVRTIILDMVKA